jgi:hypothetical protein
LIGILLRVVCNGTSGQDIEAMGIFRRKVPHYYIPIHPDNIAMDDWIILLEAGTIVGPKKEKLRVAKATKEKKIKRKYNVFLRKKHFLVLEGYNPRTHAFYFCPQLYRSDGDNNLVPLEGEEIGRLLAQSVQEGVEEKEPWYEPLEKMPGKPILRTNFDTLVVDRRVDRNSSSEAVS